MPKLPTRSLSKEDDGDNAINYSKVNPQRPRHILIKEEIGKKVQKECYKIFPLEDNCMVRKVKILKKPKFDLTKLMELYKDRPEEDKKTSGNTLAE